MLTRYTKRFAHYLRNTRAVSALEYALLLGIIATVIAAALVTLGPKMTGVLTTVGNEVAESATEVDD